MTAPRQPKPPLRRRFGWLRRHYRGLTVAANALIALLAVLAAGKEGPFEGLLFDAGVLVRDALTPGPVRASTSTAVVAMDWATLRSPRTIAMPRALFAPIWGPMIDGLVEAGAVVVTFDFVFEFSGNAFIPNYDRPFLASLARNRRHVVLGRNADVNPALPFLIAAGGRGDATAVALSELTPDSDGVVRTVQQSFLDTQGVAYPTLSGASVLRAGQALNGGPVRYLPGGRLEDVIPTWSMNDVLACLEQPGGREVLRRAVNGRVIFLGSTLPEEDRKVAADHFLLTHAMPPPPLPSTTGEGCTLNRLGPSFPISGSVPGVYLHAAATAAVLEDRVLRDAPLYVVALAAAAAAAAASLACLVLEAGAGLMIVGLLLLGGLALSWSLPLLGVWLPVGHAEAGCLAAMALSQLMRYLAEERRAKHLQALFGHYLAPQVVQQMSDADSHPELGGETRDITCMFADLSGFTALSGRLSPGDLLQVTNRFLACIVRAVDDTGGYVDKFIGDAVMAIWNAPGEVPDHPARAIAAAMAAAEAIQHEADLAAAQGEPAFAVKIGLNSGSAVVGNVGAEERYNYTAIGATVNIASRLEPLPAIYHCAVMVSEATAALAKGAWWLCEVDSVRVKGRDTPLAVFAPLARRGGGDDTACARLIAAWSVGLTAYRAGRFAEAALAWRNLPPLPGGAFGPAAVMAARADTLAQSPPSRWDGVWTIAKG